MSKEQNAETTAEAVKYRCMVTPSLEVKL